MAPRWRWALGLAILLFVPAVGCALQPDVVPMSKPVASDWSPGPSPTELGAASSSCASPAVPFGNVIGFYRGVAIHSNSACKITCGAECSSGVCASCGDGCSGNCCGFEWQCVEFVERYYKVQWTTLEREAGVDTGLSSCVMRSSGNAAQLYENPLNNSCLSVLRQFPNGGPSLPRQDDIIVWGPNAGCKAGQDCRSGHVAIVRMVMFDTSGAPTALFVAQQNVTDSSCDLNYPIPIVRTATGYDVQSIGPKYVTLGWRGLRPPNSSRADGGSGGTAGTAGSAGSLDGGGEAGTAEGGTANHIGGLGGTDGTAVTVCGDGMVSGSEGCDGMAFGTKTCSTFGFSGGTLRCRPDCTVDTTACCTPRTYYPDRDGDGFGASGGAVSACSRPATYAQTNDDCNDADPTVYPGAPDLCDLKVNDCHSTIGDVSCGTHVRRWRECTSHHWHSYNAADSMECPPDLGSAAAGCGACGTPFEVCPVTGTSLATCWTDDEAAPQPYKRFWTYFTPAPSAPVTWRLLYHCFDGLTNLYQTSPCPSGQSGTPPVLGYISDRPFPLPNASATPAVELYQCCWTPGSGPRDCFITWSQSECSGLAGLTPPTALGWAWP
jgi:hypothetical protein